MNKVVEVLHRKTGKPVVRNVDTANSAIQLNHDAQVRITAGKGEIRSMERQGHDLIVHYADGTTIRFEAYFDCPIDQLPQLIVHDPVSGQDGLVHFNGLDDAACPIFADGTAAALDYTLAPFTDAAVSGGLDTLTLAGLGALALGGIAAGVSSGGGGSSGGGNNSLSGGTHPTPPAPVITGATNNSVPGLNGALASGASTNDTTPALMGTAAAGDKISIYDGNALVGTAMADSSGHWTFTPSSPLADGTHSFTATDTTGNASPASSAFTLTVDTAPPVVTIDGTATVNVPVVRPPWPSDARRIVQTVLKSL